MSANNSCLNFSLSNFTKDMIDDGEDKTRIKKNASKFCEYCRLIRQQLEAQIFSLKDKVHQSFMQVLQIQQLHQQELDLLKNEHQRQFFSLKGQIGVLQQAITQSKRELFVMEKNSARHIYDFGQTSFFIENMEIVHCAGDNSKSQLNDSSFIQFHDLVDKKSVTPLNNFNFKSKTNSLENCDHKNNDSDVLVQNLNFRISELQSQIFNLWSTNQQLKKKSIELQTYSQSLKESYDSLCKECKFLSNHIQNLSTEKFKLERRVKEIEKLLKKQKFGETNLLRVKNKDEIASSQLLRPHLSCLNLRTFADHENEENNIFSPTSLNFQNLMKKKQNQNNRLCFKIKMNQPIKKMEQTKF